MNLSELIRLLQTALHSSQKRIQSIRNFQDLIRDFDDTIQDETVDNILRELAHDLEYYVPIDLHRAQDPSYFGDRRAKALIHDALNALKRAGVDVDKVA